MGKLIDGKWHDVWYDTKSTGGKFKRQDAGFRHWVTASGDAGPTGSAGFKAEANRYHLYISCACPWAHRTIIFRNLKGLENMIGLSVVHPHMGEDGWTFAEGNGVIPDTVNHADFLHQVYTNAKADYTGRVTVPVLWDKKKNTIVSNESSEIIRMFNTAFDRQGATPGDYYPEHLRAEIDRVNADVYDNINNGVYKAGFATTQDAYDEAVNTLFDALDRTENTLSTQRYLAGSTLTEADWRLFTTLIRFDEVYHGHFKCNKRQIMDYPNLWAFTRELFQIPGVAGTVNMDHIKRHYYGSHANLNPSGIVPVGPSPDFMAPHDRNRF